MTIPSVESKKLETCFKLLFYPKSADTFSACDGFAKPSQLIFYPPRLHSGVAVMFIIGK